VKIWVTTVTNQTANAPRYVTPGPVDTPASIPYKTAAWEHIEAARLPL
jgi:hypothetical protein